MTIKTLYVEVRADEDVSVEVPVTFTLECTYEGYPGTYAGPPDAWELPTEPEFELTDVTVGGLALVEAKARKLLGDEVYDHLVERAYQMAVDDFPEDIPF